MRAPLEFTAGYLFCGSGLGALGSDAAEIELDGRAVTFRNVGGIDFDPESCADFRMLTGAPALCADIARIRPRELRAFFGEVAPHFFKWSPPCKGASQLLSVASSQTAKYQAMNRLALAALRKVLAAWPRREERPLIIVVENVPSFRTRCAPVLQEMLRLLRRAGYEVDLRTHDLGEEGGLAQRRERFTLAARDRSRCPVPVELPPRRRLRGVGEVLGPLPWPDDPIAGSMHRLPGISWLNHVRLALVTPGGDWRDLPRRGEVVSLLRERGLWPSTRTTAEFRQLVEDQLGSPVAKGRDRREVHRRHPVQAWAEPGMTVSGPSGMGPGAIQDPRIIDAIAVGSGQRPGSTGVYAWGEPARTVIGSPWVSGGSAPASVADPRALDAIGIGQTAAGADGWKGRPGLFGVGDWQEPSPTVVGRATISGGHARAAVADPRALEQLGLGCTGRNGFYGVLTWGAPAGTVTGSLQVDNGPAAVADPRLAPPRLVIDLQLALQLLAEGWEVPRGALAPAILSPISGCWHRPLTTLELAVLQGLPWWLGDRPLLLAGRSDRRHRERIGNGIPVGGAEAWGRSVLEALARSAAGEVWRLCGGGQWVAPSDLGAVA